MLVVETAGVLLETGEGFVGVGGEVGDGQEEVDYGGEEEADNGELQETCH